MIIADTTFLVDLLRKKDTAALQKLDELQEADIPCIATTISVFELWAGLANSHSKTQEIQEIEQLISSMPLLVLDKVSAEKAGVIFSGLERQGNIVQTEDCMIAGIALAQNCPVLTRNVKHFERIPGLKIEKY